MKFSTPLIITGLMSKILAGIDILLLGNLSTANGVGIYNVIYPISSLLLIFLTSASYMYMPISSEIALEESFNDLKEIYKQTTEYIVYPFLFLFVIIIFNSNDVIMYTFSADYMVGNIELIVLPSGFYLHTLIGPNSKLLLAIGETRAMMKASIQSAILNITLNYLLIPQYSIMGAALATAGSYVVLNIIYVYYIWRSIRMSIIQIRPIVITIFGVLLYTLVNIITGVLQIKNPVLELIICVSLFSLVYAVFSILYSGVYKSINYDIVSNHFYSE